MSKDGALVVFSVMSNLRRVVQVDKAALSDAQSAELTNSFQLSHLICCSKPETFSMCEGASGCTETIAA